MIRSRTVLGVAVAAGFAICAAPALATVYTISGTGLWVSNLETIASDSAATAYSTDGATVSFSFNIAKTFAYTTMIDGYTVPTTAPATDLTDFTYSLNGVVVPTTLSPVLAPACSASGVLCDVEFFTVSQGGGIGLDFGDYTVEFAGADIGSTGTLMPGNIDALMDINYATDFNGNAIDEGTAKVSVAPAVPEPAAWLMMLVGVGGVGAVLRNGVRKPHAA